MAKVIGRIEGNMRGLRGGQEYNLLVDDMA